jgi:hypothetical protein
MKIILSETQYKKLISEDLGVSRASLSYVNLIYSILEKKIEPFLNTKKSFKETFKITLKDIKQIYQNDLDDFIDLPIEEIVINLKCVNLKSKYLSSKFTTGGGAYQIEEKRFKNSYLKTPSYGLPKKVLEEVEKTLIAKFDFDLFINNEFTDSMKDSFLFDLRDTITHECNHILEFYNRGIKGLKPIDISLSYAGKENYNIPRHIFSLWEHFLDLIYYAEPQEVRAMTQEAYSQRLRMSFNVFKTTKYWLYAKEMENFSADKLFETMANEIEKYNPDYLVPFLTNLYTWFLKDYYNIITSLGITPNKTITNSRHLLDLMKRLEPKIQNAGKKLQRNFIRLYALSDKETP